MAITSLQSTAKQCVSGLSLLALVACQQMPVTPVNQADARIATQLKETLRESEKSTEVTVPPEISRALLPTFRFNTSDEKKAAPIERRFDISAVDADVRSIFMSVVEGSQYTLVMHPDVSGKVTLQIKNTTLFDALDTMREIYGYDYRRSGNKLIVMGAGLQTRMYPVNYLNFKRTGKSDVSVSSGGLVSNAASTGITLETASEANFWDELKTTLTSIVGEKDDRKVVTNPQGGLIIVRAMPAELRMVEDFLGLTHQTIGRQVVLEAKIFEVELNNNFQSGINWAGVLQAGNSGARFSQVGGGSLPEAGASGIAGNSADLIRSNIANTTATAFGGMFSVALQFNDFRTFAELLKTQGTVQVLSSPRVSTVNNQKAVIKVGGDEYFVTGVTNAQTSTNNGQTSTTPPAVELQPFFSGIALDVTPQIDEFDHVTLHIHPTISEVSQKNKTFVIGDQSFSLPLAYSTVQESDNIVRAQSGQIVVIGGLMKEGTSNIDASLPILGDIPLLGYLFKHKKLTRTKKELVILLKPTVIDLEGPSWHRQVEKTVNRMSPAAGFAQQ